MKIHTPPFTKQRTQASHLDKLQGPLNWPLSRTPAIMTVTLLPSLLWKHSNDPERHVSVNGENEEHRTQGPAGHDLRSWSLPSHQPPHFDLSMFRACVDKSKKGPGFCLLPVIPLGLPVHVPQRYLHPKPPLRKSLQSASTQTHPGRASSALPPGPAEKGNLVLQEKNSNLKWELDEQVMPTSHMA